jgi:hypothetical protein
MSSKIVAGVVFCLKALTTVGFHCEMLDIIIGCNWLEPPMVLYQTGLSLLI